MSIIIEKKGRESAGGQRSGKRLVFGEYVDIRAHAFIILRSKMLALEPWIITGGCGNALLARVCSTDAGLWLQGSSATERCHVSG
eukprot:13002641-Heterocapsa_arctica.AAC.1